MSKISWRGVLATFGEAHAENFHWLSGKENLKEYLGVNGSKRLFCDNCGSSLVFMSSNDSGECVEFSLGTLDSDIPNRPDAHIFMHYSACWNPVTDGLPQYSEGRRQCRKNIKINIQLRSSDFHSNALY